MVGSACAGRWVHAAAAANRDASEDARGLLGGAGDAMTPPLTVVCVWVQGEYPYTVEYVRRLLAMVRRWMDRPFRFVCLTDRPEQMPDGDEAMPTASVLVLMRFCAKVELFTPPSAFSGRMLYLDLDPLIVGPLAPVVDVDAPFALIAD